MTWPTRKRVTITITTAAAAVSGRDVTEVVVVLTTTTLLTSTAVFCNQNVTGTKGWLDKYGSVTSVASSTITPTPGRWDRKENLGDDMSARAITITASFEDDIGGDGVDFSGESGTESTRGEEMKGKEEL